MKRREFLIIPAKALGGFLLTALAGELLPAIAADGLKVPLRFFTAAEAEAVQAATERIFPRDESGPGALDAGVTIYIDRQLAGPYGKDKYRYTKGPWVESIPEHGNQSKETPQQIYRAGIASLGGDFASLSPEQQNARLEAVEETYFFRMLHGHTIEGMFSDPLHGGNIGMVGWKMIGYPGPRMSYRYELDKHFGEAYVAEPRSLEQILRQPVKGIEDESD